RRHTRFSRDWSSDVCSSDLSAKFEDWAKKTTKISIVTTAIYLFWLSIASFLVMFPLSYLSFMMSKSYNISTQTFSLWMKDKLIDFWIEFAISFIVITVLYALIRKFKKRWWLGAWILSV